MKTNFNRKLAVEFSVRLFVCSHINLGQHRTDQLKDQSCQEDPPQHDHIYERTSYNREQILRVPPKPSQDRRCGQHGVEHVHIT